MTDVVAIKDILEGMGCLCGSMLQHGGAPAGINLGPGKGGDKIRNISGHFHSAPFRLQKYVQYKTELDIAQRPKCCVRLRSDNCERQC